MTLNNTADTDAKLNKLEYDGKISSLYGIWVVNILLTILTLGIYNFWGRTRLRKYVYNSYTLDGDRFEFTGTGLEIFLGFLLAFPVFLAFYLPVILFIETAPGVGFLLLPLFFLMIFAVYSAMRYRLSRIVWRGVRGRLAGSGFTYAWMVIGCSILNGITFGLMIPYNDKVIYRYVIENTYLGDQRASYDGRAAGLYWLNFFTLHVPIILVIMAYSIILAGSSSMLAGGWVDYSAPGDDINPVNVLVILLIYAIMFLAFVPRFWYSAKRTRQFFNDTTIGNMRLNATVTGGSLFGLVFGNILILIFTLGLGFPITLHRNLKFISRHFGVLGDIDTSGIGQSEESLKSTGEGFEGVFGLDTGLV